MLVALQVCWCKIFVTSKLISWKFNTAAAPWFGGFFERMVKFVKRCLKKILHNAKLNYVELLTILKEVETVINNRPLVMCMMRLFKTF